MTDAEGTIGNINAKLTEDRKVFTDQLEANKEELMESVGEVASTDTESYGGKINEAQSTLEQQWTSTTDSSAIPTVAKAARDAVVDKLKARPAAGAGSGQSEMG